MPNAISRTGKSKNPNSSRLRGSARSSLRLILERGLFGSDQPAPPGTLRGIDVLPRSTIRQRLSRASVVAHSGYGAQVDFEAPSGFFEKLVLSKFFAPIPMPSPADTLALARFIPEALRETIQPLPVIWQGPESLTPERVGDAVTEGRYYAKSNNVPDAILKLDFPLDQLSERRAKRLTRKWLDAEHSAKSSEWWRDLIGARVLLERDIRIDDAPVTQLRFHIGAGQILAVQLERDYGNSAGQAVYDADFQPFKHELFLPNQAPIEKPEYFETLRDAALDIAAPFEFVRVDICHNGAQAYLTGLNLAPLGGLRLPRSRELNTIMGHLWKSKLFAS